MAHVVIHGNWFNSNSCYSPSKRTLFVVSSNAYTSKENGKHIRSPLGNGQVVFKTQKHWLMRNMGADPAGCLSSCTYGEKANRGLNWDQRY